MSVTELLQSAQFVVDAEGHKKSVLVDVEVWDEILSMLEDVEDTQDVKRLRVLKEESIPWGQAKDNLRSENILV